MTSNWYSKTVNQLSNLVSGTTDIGSIAYWETNAYDQISEILTHLEKRPYSDDYDTIQDAIDALPT